MVEQHLRKALPISTLYYQNNRLKSNPAKTQSCLFHLRNHHATRKMNITWNGTSISHDKYPVYLGVTMDRTLSFKEHTRKLKAKIQSRNALLSKLANSKWGTNPYTLRTTALALCFSTAEYTYPVWERSAHAGKIDSALNDTCRRITGCLKPTPLNKVYSLAGIALPSSIRREVYSQSERQKCNLDQRHPMYGLTAAPSRLKSRKSFLRTVLPLDKHTTHQLKTQNLWQNYTDNILDQHKLQNFPVQESLLPGHKLQWNKWRCLNRLRSGVGKTKSLLLKWGYLPPCTDTTCQCGKENQTMNHLLTCEKTGTTCTMDDLLQCNSTAKKLATAWCNLI